MVALPPEFPEQAKFFLPKAPHGVRLEHIRRTLRQFQSTWQMRLASVPTQDTSATPENHDRSLKSPFVMQATLLTLVTPQRAIILRAGRRDASGSNWLVRSRVGGGRRWCAATRRYRFGQGSQCRGSRYFELVQEQHRRPVFQTGRSEAPVWKTGLRKHGVVFGQVLCGLGGVQHRA